MDGTTRFIRISVLVTAGCLCIAIISHFALKAIRTAKLDTFAADAPRGTSAKFKFHDDLDFSNHLHRLRITQTEELIRSCFAELQEKATDPENVYDQLAWSNYMIGWLKYTSRSDYDHETWDWFRAAAITPENQFFANVGSPRASAIALLSKLEEPIPDWLQLTAKDKRTAIRNAPGFDRERDEAGLYYTEAELAERAAKEAEREKKDK